MYKPDSNAHDLINTINNIDWKQPVVVSSFDGSNIINDIEMAIGVTLH